MRKAALGAMAALLLAGSASSASGQAIDALGPCERATEQPPGAPVNVELATVTDTEFVVTWLTCSAGKPVGTDSTVSYGSLTDASLKTFTEPGETPFHNVRVSGLEPGKSYRYVVSSGGIPAPPDRLNPGAFTTLVPPEGKELFRFSALADIHLGEEVSGIATSTPTELPPGYRNEAPYPAVMLEAAVDGVDRERVSLSLLPADNTSHGELSHMLDAKRLLDELDGRYLIARGAHDRPDQYDEAKQQCPPDGDCFREVFRPKIAPDGDGEPQHLPQAIVHKRWLFIALDSANLASGTGEISEDQMDWLRRQLERAAKRKWPAIVTFHHPVSEYSTTLAVPPVVFGVNQRDAQEFLQLIGRYDVRMVINSHTHRNWISYSPHTGRMPILEVGPTKEYPGGYSVFRVYESGIVREWFPIDCELCNEWRETTRGEYFSLYPYYTTGSLRDRNFVHSFERPDVPGVPSLPFGVWPPLVPRTA